MPRNKQADEWAEGEVLCSDTKPAEAGTKRARCSRAGGHAAAARGSVRRPHGEVACEQRPGGSESCRNPGQRPQAWTCWYIPETAEHSEAGTGGDEARRGMGQVLPGLEGCHQASGWPESPGGFAKQLTWISCRRTADTTCSTAWAQFARGLLRSLLSPGESGWLGAGHGAEVLAIKPGRWETDGQWRGRGSEATAESDGKGERPCAERRDPAAGHGGRGRNRGIMHAPRLPPLTQKHL